MSETDQAYADYLRTLRTVAEHRVVDEAEDVLARAWLDELDAARQEALLTITVVRSADAAARAEVRAARGGHPADLAVAQWQLAATKQALEDETAAMCAFLAGVDEHIELTCRAASLRQIRRRAEMDLLREAWNAVYGPVRAAAAGVRARGGSDGGADGAEVEV